MKLRDWTPLENSGGKIDWTFECHATRDVMYEADGF